MRKTVIFLAFIFLACKLPAQWFVTPEAGYNRSIFYTDAPTTQIVTSSISGFQAGALVTKKWEKTKSWLDYLFVQSGLEFAQKGSYQGRGYQSVYGSNSNIKLAYIQAPLNVGVNVKIYHDLGVMASAGLYLAYGVSGTDKGTTQDISGSSNIDRNITFTSTGIKGDNSKTYIKPWDNGYNLAAGFTYKNLLLKTTFSLGTGNISPVSDTRYQNEVWNFSLGYTIRVK
jgi:hypothetical protein